jgi:hypothetical protein
MSGTVTPDLKGLSREEKVQKLADRYDDEMLAELNKITDNLRIVAQACQAMGMPPAKVWASMVVSSAEALEFDLDTPAGLGAAVLLAHLQMPAADQR